jgi:hypothetical protein
VLFGNLNWFNISIDFDPVETSFLVLFNNANALTIVNSKYGDTINNSWLHVAMVVGNQQTIKLYINGEFIGSVANTASITGNLLVKLGNSGYPSTLQNRFNAYLNDYRAYNREISANEILSLYETTGNIDYQLNLNIEEV